MIYYKNMIFVKRIVRIVKEDVYKLKDMKVYVIVIPDINVNNYVKLMNVKNLIIYVVKNLVIKMNIFVINQIIYVNIIVKY